MTSGPSRTNSETQGEGDLTPDVAGRLGFEALVNDLAAGFMNFEPERVDQAIEKCLRRIVEVLGLDRSTLRQRSGDYLGRDTLVGCTGAESCSWVLGTNRLP